MDNKTKYALIKEIKQLIVETDIRNKRELYYTPKISLNATKVLNFIYNNADLTRMFEENVANFNELKNNAEKYKQALQLRQKQIIVVTPEKDRTKLHFTNDFIIEMLKTTFKEGEIVLFEDPLKYYGFFETRDSIFQYIDTTLLMKYENYWTIVNEQSKDWIEYLSFANSEFNSAFCKADKDIYRKNLAKTYDYYYLWFYEKNIDNVEYKEKGNHALFLFVAYMKVLMDCLEYLYKIGSPEQKDKQDKQKIIKCLTPAEKDIIDILRNNISLTVKEIATIRKVSDRTIERQITMIIPKIANKKGGIKELKKILSDFK